MESIEIDLIDELPKIRKILDNSTARQKTEIEIVKKIRDNPQPNIVDIYEVVEPTNTEKGYISQEVLISLEDENARILQIDERVIDYLNTLDRDVEATTITTAFALYCIYRSSYRKCRLVNKRINVGKFFDFDHSGILKNDAGVCIEDEWEIEPEEAIKYRTIKKETPPNSTEQITRSKSPTKNKQDAKNKKEKLF